MFNVLFGITGLIGWFFNGFEYVTWSNGTSTTYFYGNPLE